jgi:hypothetical protein
LVPHVQPTDVEANGHRALRGLPVPTDRSPAEGRGTTRDLGPPGVGLDGRVRPRSRRSTQTRLGHGARRTGEVR